MTIAQQIGRAHASAELSTKAREFVNLARIIALSRGNHADAQQLAQDKLMGPTIKSIVAGHHRVYEMRPDLANRLKAAVSAGSTTDSSWALPLSEYQTLASAFLESLRNWSAFDAMLAGGMKRVPFRVRVGSTTVGLTGSTVSQASIKPISKLTLSASQIDETKVSCVIVLTEELARFASSTAGSLFETELSAAVAVQTDAEFISVLASGATTFASNGPTAEHARVDLRGMLNSITTSQRSRLYLLTTSAVAKALSVLHTSSGDAAFPTLQYNGGSVSGITLLVSDGVPSGQMILVDATQIAAASEAIRLDTSQDAVLNMDTVGDSPISASTVMHSLWQHNEVGLRAERYIGIEKLTTTGVVVVTSVNFSGDSPGP
jgi:hypothetical protein